MSEVESVILADDRPSNLPLSEDVVQLCETAGYNLRGIPVMDESLGIVSAWIKHGSSLTMGEALTQDWVGKVLNADPDAAVRIPIVYQAFRYKGRGYIVMEYIDGSVCGNRDAKEVAAAVESLIGVVGPTAVPGPVGGGPIGHCFFVDWESSVTYPTVRALEKHINGILASMPVPQRVSFEDEVRDGLRLCPCDMNRANFMKVPDGGKIVALDFEATCFLPSSFFAFALAAAWDPFAQRLARHVKYPESKNLSAMLKASYYLVPFQRNTIGLPRELRHNHS